MCRLNIRHNLRQVNNFVTFYAFFVRSDAYTERWCVSTRSRYGGVVGSVLVPGVAGSNPAEVMDLKKSKAVPLHAVVALWGEDV
jgi:hypothetical protein